MSSTYAIGNEASVSEQTVERDEDGFEVVDETPELRPSVEQSIQAKVDYSDDEALNGRLFGQTLEAEERMKAREWEVERTRIRFDRSEDSDREVRSRTVVRELSVEKHHEFRKRAASVDPTQDPDLPDPRERLSREELAAVNREAARMSGTMERWTRAAISRRLAERVLDGTDVTSAVIGVFEELQRAPGQVIPIGAVGEVRRREVSIQGRVATLWEPSHPKIQQVGLVEDETGRIKVTLWKRSRQPWMKEGELVRLEEAAVSWYKNRPSVALTGWSRVEFPEHERWWAE